MTRRPWNGGPCHTRNCRLPRWIEKASANSLLKPWWPTSFESIRLRIQELNRAHIGARNRDGGLENILKSGREIRTHRQSGNQFMQPLHGIEFCLYPALARSERLLGEYATSDVDEGNDYALDAVFGTSIGQDTGQIPLPKIVADFSFERGEFVQYRLGIGLELVVAKPVGQVGDRSPAISDANIEQFGDFRCKAESESGDHDRERGWQCRWRRAGYGGRSRVGRVPRPYGGFPD